MPDRVPLGNVRKNSNKNLKKKGSEYKKKEEMVRELSTKAVLSFVFFSYIRGSDHDTYIHIPTYIFFHHTTHTQETSTYFFFNILSH